MCFSSNNVWNIFCVVLIFFSIFQLFYTMTAVEDLDEWQQKTVGLTESADLFSLEKYAQYAIAVAARTKTVSRINSVIINNIHFSIFSDFFYSSLYCEILCCKVLTFFYLLICQVKYQLIKVQEYKL